MYSLDNNYIQYTGTERNVESFIRFISDIEQDNELYKKFLTLDKNTSRKNKLKPRKK